MSVTFPVSSFDPKIPLFTFLSLLGINTHRILSRLSQPFAFYVILCTSSVYSAGGRTDCTWDCDVLLEYVYVYRDPACLFDCVNYPICVQQLFEDYKDQGRVGSDEKNLYNGTEEIIIVLYEIFS